EAGVLARVIGLFSGRGYNIDSLTVAPVESEGGRSRINVVTSGTEMVIEQIKAQLDRLVPVHRVADLSREGPHIAREMALIKDIAVGLRPKSGGVAKADAAGLKVMDPADCAKWADVVMVLTPDEGQGDLYREKLGPDMKSGAALAFAHGLNVHFNLIDPRPDLDVFMIAPKGPGHTVRSEYQRGGGVP